MCLMLWSSGFVVGEMLQCFEDVGWHAEVDISLVIIPVKNEAEITCAFPVGVA